jgi:hypothetical protein
VSLPDWIVPSFMSGSDTRLRLSMTPAQLIAGLVLLAGGIGFAKAHRRQR